MTRSCGAVLLPASTVNRLRQWFCSRRIVHGSFIGVVVYVILKLMAPSKASITWSTVLSLEH